MEVFYRNYNRRFWIQEGVSQIFCGLVLIVTGGWFVSRWWLDVVKKKTTAK